ncbi:hypothetical protein B0T20DRAFT_481519 [Sordaria brevicollis]|uniref:Mid2 domain-containing protein n=1 Tax=Sordaria brevicollis TaxID=83679 RepID=A0AAE0UAL3_SORBR|nr:hypothetical protein B0T20DRAFT_481519 [Sordaria brevicollis]
MRISLARRWLLAALSLASPVASQTAVAQDPVKFDPAYGFIVDPSDPRLGRAAIIKLGSLPPTFKWTKMEGVSVHGVYLNKIRTAGADEKIGYGGNPITGGPNIDGKGQNVVPKISLIDDSWNKLALWDDEKPSINSLYFEARWTKDGKDYETYSRLFTLVNGGIEAMIIKALENNEFKNEGPYQPKVKANEPSPTTTTSRNIPSAITQVTVTSTSTPTSTTGDNTANTPDDKTGQNISDPEPSSPKSKKGLSLGAIIGIAIACGLIGLALIGGIIFCCLRRRQKQNALGGVSRGGMSYGGSGRNGDELMAEKEANAGVLHDVTSAPTSPYSDDGHNHQQHLMGMGSVGSSNRDSGSVVMPNTGAGVPAHGVLPGVDARLEGGGGSPVSNAPSHPVQHDHQSGRSYTMYSDHQSGGGRGDGSPTTLHSGGGAPSLRHGGAGTENNRGSLISQQQQARSLSTPYAHLVEEGMTEDQIRALEEEERQLDAAIEQHVGGRRGSRNI